MTTTTDTLRPGYNRCRCGKAKRTRFANCFSCAKAGDTPGFRGDVDDTPEGERFLHGVIDAGRYGYKFRGRRW